MKKKVTERSLQALKTKKKLFQSAAKLIAKHGYDNVTVEGICRKAGVSVGAFYHYYISKSDIIVEFFKEIDSFYEEKVVPELTQDAVSNIVIFFRYYAKFHIDQGIAHTSMFIKIQHEVFLDKTRYMYIKLLELVNDGLAEGVFRVDADPTVIEDYLLVIARGLIFDWSLARGNYDLTAKMEAYIRLAMQSFRQ